MSRWFRFYADAMRNPKVLRLSDKDFRLWVRLLAVASENEGHIASVADLKMVLAMRLDHLEGGLDRLISGGLIDPLADGYEPHGWAKFQFKSDVSTERVHKHRAKRNVSETPPDTETEAEVEADASTPPISPKADPFPRPPFCDDPQHWTDLKANRKTKRLPNTPTAYAKFLRDIQQWVDPEWPPGRVLEAIAARGWASAEHDPRGARNDRLQPRQADLRPSAGSRGERRNLILDMVRAAEAPDDPEGDCEPDWQGRPALRAIGQV